MTHPTPEIRAEVISAALPSFKPIGTDEIITVGGRTGIFTPLSGKDAENTENLGKIVDVLRSELAGCARTTRRCRPGRRPDRAGAVGGQPRGGVQNASTSFADRLGAMSNATSDFAVREFTLESKVHVDVTEVGTIGFQFVRPGEVVNAAALSTVTLTVVPVPKPVVDPVDGVVGVVAPDSPVESLGVSEEQATRLHAAHIATTRDFARIATRATATAQLVSMLGVSREELGRYTLLAGLLTMRTRPCEGCGAVRGRDPRCRDVGRCGSGEARDAVREGCRRAGRRRTMAAQGR